MLPLQIPGGIELLVILLLLGVPIAILALLVALLRRRRGRIEALESRIDRLEAELEDRE